MANTSTKNATNKANNDKTQMDGKAEDLPDFSKWTKHQIGFAPYWRPTDPGSWCYMEVVSKDTRDPMFHRFLCTAMKTTDCRRGPGNSDESVGIVGEAVNVPTGDAFTVSVYHSLAEEFGFFQWLRAEHNIRVPMKLTAVKKTPTKNLDDNGEPRKVWNWELLSDPKHRPAIEKHRDEYRKLLAKANEESEREQVQD